MVAQRPIERVSVHPYAVWARGRPLALALFFGVISGLFLQNYVSFASLGVPTPIGWGLWLLFWVLVQALPRVTRYYGMTIELYDDRVIRDPGPPSFLGERRSIDYDAVAFGVRKRPGTEFDSVFLIRSDPHDELGTEAALGLRALQDGGTIERVINERAPTLEARDVSLPERTGRRLVYERLDPSDDVVLSRERVGEILGIEASDVQPDRFGFVDDVSEPADVTPERFQPDTSGSHYSPMD